MPPFSLAIQSVRPPTLPSSVDLSPGGVRSSLIPNAVSPTSPLYFTLSLPHAHKPKDPLYPATHLQLSYRYEGTGEIFVPHFIMPERLVRVDNPSATSDPLFEVEVPPEDVARVKVNHGETSTGEVLIYAWRNEKLLGKWSVCQIEGLGIEGLKSFDLAILRAENWKAQREAAAARARDG